VRERLKIMKNSAKKSRRLLAISVVLVVTAIIAAGAATVVSRQNSKQSATQKGAAPAMNTRNNVTVNASGQEVHLDTQTGQAKELTPEEARKMAEGLKQMINTSTEGLQAEQQADGSVSVDLQDRFQNVTLARVNQDGTVSTACVDNAEAAGEFLGIDPRMIDENAKVGKNGKPLPVTPAKTEEK
jgi:hypothetical protein